MRLSQRALSMATASSPSCEGLVVTPRCFEHVRKTLSPKGELLRVAVDAGGCGGFQYRFEVVDKVEEDDVCFEQNEARVCTDPVSLGFLDGAILDHQTTMMRSGYSILSNPHAEMACGCGTSFSAKM